MNLILIGEYRFKFIYFIEFIPEKILTEIVKTNIFTYSTEFSVLDGS